MNVKLNSQPQAASSHRHPHFGVRHAFTLIELMAVAVVIALLASIAFGVYGYVQKRMAIQTTRAQIAAMSAALELYRSDWGYYPATTSYRISGDGTKEAVNNWYLWRALTGVCTGCTKAYMRFSANQLRNNPAAGNTNNVVTGGSYSGGGGYTNIYDAWGVPFNYYCSPSTPYGVSNTVPTSWYPTSGSTNGEYYGGYTVGGQVNIKSFDLFSYGPDHYTYVPGAVGYSGGYNYAWYYGNAGTAWTTPSAALDDITNFGK